MEKLEQAAYAGMCRNRVVYEIVFIILLQAIALSYINSLAPVLCIHLSLLTVLLTYGTVC